MYFFLARPAEPVNDLTVNGNLAYLALGRVGVEIVDVSNPENPDKIGSFDTSGISKAVAVENQYMYIADGREGLRILNVSDPRFPGEVGFFNTPSSAEDVAVVNKFAYVADGRSGLLVINVEDKSSPKRFGNQSEYKINGSILRVAIQENYAYLGDNRNNLRIVNINNPRKIEEVSVLDVGAEIKDMDVLGDRAYLATGVQGMVVVDISDPVQPVILNTFDTSGVVQDVAVDGGVLAYLADGTNGLLVLDITDLNVVEPIGSYDQFLNANQVALNEGALYVSDRDSSLNVVDADVNLVTRSLTSTEKQLGIAQDVAIGGSLAYVAYAGQGLRVIDFTKPNAPWEVTAYSSPGEARAVTVSGDFIYLADGSAGLQVLFLESADAETVKVVEISAVDTPGETFSVAVSGQVLYLADGFGGMRVISVVDPTQPESLGWIDTPGDALDVALLGDFAYIADGTSGLRIINIQDGTNPVEVGTYDTPGEARAVELKEIPGSPGKIQAYVADGEGGLRVIDVSDPMNPQELGSFTVYKSVFDLNIAGDLVYLAAGDLGMRIVNVSDPAVIGEVGAYDTPGEAKALDLSEQYTFIADSKRGLRIVDITNPVEPLEVGFYDIPRMVRGVEVEANYAYLTGVENGFRIADVSDPHHLRQVGYYDQGGVIADMAIQGNKTYLANDAGLQIVEVGDAKNPVALGSLELQGRGTSIFVINNLAYVTSSEFGLHIADVSDPMAIRSLGMYDTPGVAQDIYVVGNYAYIADGEAGLVIVNVANPSDPRIASLLDQFQNVTSVIVLGEFAYLADGPNGIWVIDVHNPVLPETIAYLDTPGTALDLENSGAYLFVADGEAGVQEVYIRNPYDPAIVGGLELEGNSLDLDMEWRSGNQGNIGSYFIYVAKGDRGLEILGAGKSVVATVTGLYETPGMAPLSQVLWDGVPIIGGPGKEKSARTVRQTFFDISVVGVLGLLIWLAFFAQFLLPIKSLRERRDAFNRLLRYLLRSHGPAIRIENGKVKMRPGEQERSGPGVVLLDTASAAMLRTKTAFKRAVGPGVIFTEDGEFLHHEAVDLHTQVRPLPPLGPLGNEDPFAPRKRKEQEEQYQARYNRRKETSGLTRDGVEVVANILAVVKTRSLPGQGGTRFGFNSRVVRLAITREGVLPNGLRNIPWYEVPAYLAVDIWREYLGKFTLTELFTTPSEGDFQFPDLNQNGFDQAGRVDNQTRLETIFLMLKMRLTQPKVPKLDKYGEPLNEQQESREYRILEEMGVQVVDVSISGIRFPRTVESQLVQQWLSTWLQRAKAERNAVERKRILAGEKGDEMALLDFAKGSVRILGEALVDDDGNELPHDSKLRPDLRASLEMLVMGTQQSVARNTTLHEWMLNEESILMKILEWTRR